MLTSKELVDYLKLNYNFTVKNSKTFSLPCSTVRLCTVVCCF